VKSFEHYLSEGTKPGKNLHMEHIEEEILNHGVAGGRGAINFLRSIRDMLAGHSKSKVDISVKWDGAPAIFAGTDPEDGKFFVGTKGVFNVTPKLVKTTKDLDQFHAGLRPKLKLALKYFSKLGIPEGVVLQGDMMYTKDELETKVIEGVKYLIFQPNTIVYAIPLDSNFAKRIMKTQIGIVWHTTYSGGPKLADMTASFGANVKPLKRSASIWFDNAEYRDLSGKVTLTEKETARLTAHLSKAGKIFQKMNSRQLDKFLHIQNTLGGAVGSSFKTFTNSKIRTGEQVLDPRAHTRAYAKYFEAWWKEKAIGKVKSPKAKAQKTKLMKEHLRVILRTQKTLHQVVEFQGHIIAAKDLIVHKLNSGAQTTKLFVRTADGYKVTNPEGFVAIDRIKGNAIKLVDRLEFSHLNFTVVKSWDK